LIAVPQDGPCERDSSESTSDSTGTASYTSVQIAAEVSVSDDLPEKN
jgi:hypothetical protein